MASIGHIAVGLAFARHLRRDGGSLIPPMIAFSALSMLPDLDVIGCALGVPYGAPFGHRGACHSLVFAVVCGLATIAVTYARPVGSEDRARRALRLGFYVLCVVASHGLLDAMTTGGKGVALLWPFTPERFFFAWRPIPVAPIGTAFFSRRGLHVAAIELVEFAPFLAYAIFAGRKLSNGRERIK